MTLSHPMRDMRHSEVLAWSKGLATKIKTWFVFEKHRVRNKKNDEFCRQIFKRFKLNPHNLLIKNHWN